MSSFVHRLRSLPATLRVSWLVLCCLCAPAHLSAAPIADLYQATVRVADRGEAARKGAFVTALGGVLSKITGRRETGVLVANAGDPQRYVRSYAYTTAGQLEVGFDEAAINQLIERNGLPLWGAERPLTLVMLPSTLQSAREARAVFEQTARMRGVPVVWASESSDGLGGASAAQLQALGEKSNAAAVLLAFTTADLPSPANVRWQFVFNGVSQESRGAMDEGPMLAADTMARYYAVSTRESVRVAMDVAGIVSIDAYGNSLNYLSRLPQVREVKVESLQQDRLRLQLDLRGNAEGLRRALAIDQRLVEQGAADASLLSYRYTR